MRGGGKRGWSDEGQGRGAMKGGNNGGLTGGITGRAGVAAGNLPFAGTVPQPRAGVGAEGWEGVPGEGGAALCAGLCAPLTSAAAPGRSGAGGGGSGGEGGDVPGIRDAPASAERGERRLPPPPPPPPPPSPPPSLAAPRSAPPPPAPPGTPSPRRAPIEPPSVQGWGSGGVGRGVGRSRRGTRRDKGPGGAEDSRGTDLSPHRSAPRTVPRHRGGPEAAPNPDCPHRSPPDHPLSPCASGGCPPPQGPSCPAEPPPLPWACGDPRDARVGVPQHGGAPNSRPQSSASPHLGSVGRGVPALPCPWHPRASGGSRGESWTDTHEQPQGRCRGPPSAGAPQAGALCLPDLSLGRWVQLLLRSGASQHLLAEAAAPQPHLPPPLLCRGSRPCPTQYPILCPIP